MTPAIYLRDVLNDLENHVDASNVPLTEEEENRLAWLGVELQALDKELARINNVSDLTNDGETGALVSYVYPDSPATEVGVEQGYILLRLYVEDYPKPVNIELEEDRYGSGAFPWDRLDEVPVEYLEDIPSPWPSAANTLRRILTDIGFGKGYIAEFFHDGKLIKKELVVTQSPTHYDSARRFKSEELGLTVRDLTFEVRRHFHKGPGDPGVLVSKVEPGGKSAVAGIKPFEIITHVNDKPVQAVGDFEGHIEGQGELRFSVLRMTRRRLVKIKMAAPVKEREVEEAPAE
jgi:S1-C subfamily serine protease